MLHQEDSVSCGAFGVTPLEGTGLAPPPILGVDKISSSTVYLHGARLLGQWPDCLANGPIACPGNCDSETAPRCLRQRRAPIVSPLTLSPTVSSCRAQLGLLLFPSKKYSLLAFSRHSLTKEKPNPQIHWLLSNWECSWRLRQSICSEQLVIPEGVVASHLPLSAEGKGCGGGGRGGGGEPEWLEKVSERK